MNKSLIFILAFIFIFSLFIGESIAQEALSWQDCVIESAKNHPDLVSAKENVTQAQASKKITASTLFPQVSSNVDATRAKTSGSAANTYEYGVSGTQLLFDANKTVNNVKAANENIKVEQYNYKFTSSDVRFRLRSAFVNLLKAQELLNLTQDIYNIRRSNLMLITLRYESGLEHKGALLTAQANAAEATFEIEQAKRGLITAQRDLIKELGRMDFTSVEVKGDFIVKNPEKEKPDFEVIVKNNPSLESLAAKIIQANFSLRAAYDNFAPVISASAGANRTGAHWPANQDQWNVGVGLTYPIFEGGLRTAQVSQAQSLYSQAKANERSGHDGLILTLEETWATLQDSIETVDVQQLFLVASEERSKIAEAEYSTGFITYDNWTIIEDDLVSAKKAFLNAQSNALLAEANWIQAKGDTLEYEK